MCLTRTRCINVSLQLLRTFLDAILLHCFGKTFLCTFSGKKCCLLIKFLAFVNTKFLFACWILRRKTAKLRKSATKSWKKCFLASCFLYKLIKIGWFGGFVALLVLPNWVKTVIWYHNWVLSSLKVYIQTKIFDAKMGKTWFLVA